MKSNLFKKQLTDVDSVKTTVRPMSTHVEVEKILVYIDESQQQDIKNALGDNLFIDLLRYVNRSEREPANDAYDNLLHGGIYKNGNDEFIFSGLEKALKYFVYARLVKHGDRNLSRVGLMQNQSEYSSHAELKEKQEEYKEAFSIAEELMNDCLRYIKHNSDKFPKWGKGCITPVRGPVISKIGD
ncbi:DUF6712 family protein [Parabacteroides faecis]|uniref:DUF6712 family protein n=1 Tax=Parabacteroides faecis TaxID=1217282 RepID=UPI003521C4A5